MHKFTDAQMLKQQHPYITSIHTYIHTYIHLTSHHITGGDAVAAEGAPGEGEQCAAAESAGAAEGNICVL
jgi:hypothetical protein